MEVKAYIKKFEKNEPKAMVYWYIAMGFELLGMGINKAGAFILPLAQTVFVGGNKSLSTILLVAYMLERVIFQINCYIRSRIRMKYDKLNKLDIDFKTNKLYNMTRGRIIMSEKPNENTDKLLYRKMSNAEVMKCCYENISNARNQRDVTVKSVMDIGSTTIMLIGALCIGASKVTKVNEFILVSVFSILLSSFVSYKQAKRRRVFYKISRDLSNKVTQEQYDLLNIKPINKKHKLFLINNYINSNRILIDKTNQKNNKDLFDWLICDVVTSISIVLLVMASMTGNTTLNLETFTMLIALFTLYARVIEKTNTQIRDVQDILDARSQHKISKELFRNIVEVYIKEGNRKFNKKISINNIKIDNYEYIYYSEQDNKLLQYSVKIPHIDIAMGETVLLSGESGSGKSTFIKSLIGESDTDITTKCIKINNKGKYNKITNAILYDADMKFGSKTIFEEITFKELTEQMLESEREKIISILNGLKLTETIHDKIKNLDIIEATKQLHFDKFSVGQQQRLVLARMLYNLNGKVDIVFLDEPTANLDVKTSIDIMKYIKQFCNEDKARAIVVATHDLEVMVNEKLYDKWYQINSEHTMLQMDS